MGEQCTDTSRLSRTIERDAANIPLLVLDESQFERLVVELGTPWEALTWLAELAATVGHPIALHVAGLTTVLSPPAWSEDRLRGWIAPHHDELEEAFGRISGLYSPEDTGA